jgi:quercetin 2,3-dioxygenase
MSRKIVEAIHPALRDDIGDLVTWRPLPGPDLPHLDPFLFLNHHGPQTYPPNNQGLPFGPHPHRGFETVTFILEGSLEHRDSGGGASVIEAGGVQWMTAGRGLVHAEVSPEAFRQRGGPLEILQLWINLPARLKMIEPFYLGLQSADMPVVDEHGLRLQLISGSWKGARGPVASNTGVFMSVVDLASDGALDMDALSGRTMFLYVVAGSLLVEGAPARERQLVRCSASGDSIALRAVSPARILLGHAAPIGEPIVSRGPFVMNSAQEIDQAIQDYRAGLFGGMS